MSQRTKKKPPFFNLKRLNGSFDEGEPPSSPRSAPSTPQPMNSHPFVKCKTGVASKTMNQETKPKKLVSQLSAGGIRELVQCPLCLEVLHNPKMLPCQHTFCMACLSVYIADHPIIDCPICSTRIQVKGSNFLAELPSNLYIDSLLRFMGIEYEAKKETQTPPLTPAVGAGCNGQSVDLFAAGVRCAQCKTMCDSCDVSSCQHCRLNFCRVCWTQHLEDMRTQIGSIVKQLDSAAGRLEHKIEHYKDRCERIVEQINITAEEKINSILEAKDSLLQEAGDLQKTSDMSALALKTSLQEARLVATEAMELKDLTKDKDQVKTFMNLHQNALQLLSEISKWDTESYVFDKENFRIERDSTTPLDAESDEPLPEGARQHNPLESEEALVLYYRSRNFIPHYVWRKTARPCGVSIGPWDNHLYVCGMDSHCVLVVERSQAKIVGRLTCEEMLCPVHIAFLKSVGEIYVTDKWKHCVHVFSKNGDYVRSIGQKGNRVGTFRSPEGIAADNTQELIYVVDTGNDRVQVLQPDGKFIDQFGLVSRHQNSKSGTMWDARDTVCTELNAPTSVAVTADRVIILDSGNRRVKVYSKQDKSKIAEFGSLGQRKGQFRQPEVLAVDPMGFILVGDSGNCRVQVFKQNGQLVRVFGGLGSTPGKFGWISGIHVTKQLDIIVSDTKNHIVNFI